MRDDSEQNAGTMHPSNQEHLPVFKASPGDNQAMRGLEIYHLISGPMRCLETDQLNSGQMIGLKINITGRGQTYKHTSRHSNSMTDPAQREESVKIVYMELFY